MSDWLTSRSVSGNITLTDISARSYRLKSVSGDIRLKMKAGFEQMELRHDIGGYDHPDGGGGDQLIPCARSAAVKRLTALRLRRAKKRPRCTRSEYRAI